MSYSVKILRAIDKLAEALSRGEKPRLPLTYVLRCARATYFDLREETHPAERVNILKLLGKVIHLSLYEVEGCLPEPTIVVCDKQVCLEMKPDAICDEHVIEVKTVSKLVNIPRLHHVAQLKAYMFFTGRRGVLIYISRSEGRCREFVYDRLPSKRYIEALFERAAWLAASVERGEAPEPEPGIWCRTCPWKSRCSGNVEEVQLDHGLNKILELAKE